MFMMDRIIKIFLLIGILIFISCEIVDKVEEETVSQPLKNDIEQVNLDGHEENYKTEDSLINITTNLITLLKERNYIEIQPLLHPDGCYFFTLGQIIPKEFNEEILMKRTSFLDGAYSYSGGDTNVSGLYFIESMDSYNYDSIYEETPFQIGDYYSVKAFGFTGNYSSNHLMILDSNGNEVMFYDAYYNEGYDPDIKVVYVPYSSCEDCGTLDYLMVELYKYEDSYKVYAIGNLEWTP